MDTVANSVNETSGAPRAIGIWLLWVAALIFVMVVVGGITRLTESGLSIVDWRPVSGILPPMSDSAWQAEFDKYRQFPEYQVLNRGMSLDEFKTIFWWEYIHRVIGRLIGLAFAIPLLIFWVRGQIPDGYRGKLVVLLILGSLQGLLGWYMVKSGLVDVPEVSHYRLSAHLSLALLIFAAVLWVALDLLRPAHGCRDVRLRTACHILIAVLAVQLVLGGLVAGLKAGYAFNTWPLMGERFVPEGYWAFSPWWSNLLDNPATVQFNHRMLGYAIGGLALGILVAGLGRHRSGPVRLGLTVLAVTIAAQIILGILTIVLNVPISIAAMHQAVGVLVLASTVYLAHSLRRRER